MEGSEARDIAKAYADVAQYYPKLKMPGHVSAVVTLGSIVAVNYGARVMAFRMRKANERQGPRVVQQSRPVQPVPSKPMQTQDLQAPLSPSVANMPPNAFTPAPSKDGWTAPENAPLKRREVTTEMRTGEIPGVGPIVFPPDHPLLGGKPFP
jgi:hypothetical protein